MEPAKPAPAGYLSSLRSLGDGLLAGAQDRLELFTVELQEEKFRLIQTFIWISAALFAAMMTVTFASLALVYFFWESARLAVLSGLAIFYAAVTFTIVIAFCRYLARLPRPFSAMQQEIGEDRACIRNES